MGLLASPPASLLGALGHFVCLLLDNALGVASGALGGLLGFTSLHGHKQKPKQSAHTCQPTYENTLHNKGVQIR